MQRASARSRREGAETEAYTWPVTAMLAGFAAGTTTGGLLVEHVDWHACFIAARRFSGVLGASLAFAGSGARWRAAQPA